jgi:predicted dehydrogenase
MDNIRIGIAGAGFVAALHARVYESIHGAGAEIAGITSRTRSKAEALAQKHHIARVLPDFQSLIASDEIDVIDLCVPNYIHKDFVLQAIQAGKHVICEKPLTGYFGNGEAVVGKTPKAKMLAEAVASADEMVQAAEQQGVKLMYAENWLYSPVIQRAKRLIKASGGTIFELRGEESHHGSHTVYAKSWRNTGGGSLIRLGAHPIGAILHLKACEGVWRNGQPITPVAVMADTANLAEIDSFKQDSSRWIVRDWEDVENWSSAILTFSDGSKATVSATDVCLGGMKDTLDLFLSNARIHCDFSRSNIIEAYAPDPSSFEGEYLMEKLETNAGWSNPSIDEDWLLGYHHELRDFVEAVQDDREPLATGQLGRDVVEVIYAAYLSAEEGKSVQLREMHTV